jgi:membrane-associated phospholipid phosphatase
LYYNKNQRIESIFIRGVAVDSPDFWKKAQTALLFWLLAGATYFIIPYLAFFKPSVMPYMTLDEIIPFWPWTALIYFTLYLQVFVVFFSAPYERILKKLFWAYMAAMGILSGFYLLLPSTHNFPASHLSPPLDCFDDLVVWLRRIDFVTNQFPSGHVIYSLSGPIFYLAIGRYKTGLPLLIWGIIISVSALTVKQHNAVDALAALPIAILIGLIFGRIAFKSLKRFGPKPL